MAPNNKNIYSSAEISPDLPQDVNTEIVKKEWLKSFIGYFVAAIPITFGCLIEYKFIEALNSKPESKIEVDFVKGLFSFQGGAGAALVFVGLLIIIATRFEIKSKNASVQEKESINNTKIEVMEKLKEEKLISEGQFNELKKQLFSSILNSDLKWWHPADWFRKVKTPKNEQ